MDPELKRMLDETHAFAKENHRMLRAIRRHQWWSFVWTIVVWVVVLALPLYLYQRYVEPIVATFSEASGLPAASGPFGLPTSADIEKLIHSFKAGQ